MTPAEFRCAREYLGLTNQWIATRLMVNPRAVLRWEVEGVPEHAATFMEDLLDKAASTVERIVHNKELVGLAVPRQMAWHQGEYPPTWHRAIAARVRQQRPVTIEYR